MARDPVRFWNRIARKYAASPISDEAAYERKLAETQALMRPDMTVIEFGCGTGSTAVRHAPHVAHYTGVDVSAAMLDYARAKGQDLANLSFVEATLESFPAPEGRADMILALSLLHLLDDPRAAIARIHGMLKPGGWFVSSTACMGDILPALRFVAPLGHAVGLLPPLSFFTEAQLTGWIEAEGFHITTRWRPEGKSAASFLIARKPEGAV